MIPLRSCWLVVVLVIAIPASVQADWPNLNPFSGAANPSGEYWYPGKYISSAWSGSGQSQGTGWSIFPKSQPSFGQPSTFSRMMNGTKEAIYNTADFLNPFYNRPQYPGPFAPTGSSDMLNNRAPVQTKTKGPASTPWYMPYDYSEPEERPTTVSDFLKLPKPGFNDE